jgi:hypothetical protein
MIDGKSHHPQSASEQIQNLLLGQAWKQHAAGMKGKAISTGWRACVTKPSRLNAWKSLLALVLK